MDAPNPPGTDIFEPYDPAGCPSLGHNVARDLAEAAWREFKQMARDGNWPHLPRSYTITEAAAKTGRPRREIYCLIQKGEIEARMNNGPALWLIPEEEVEKLMPEDSGSVDESGPAEAPSSTPHPISNNKL